MRTLARIFALALVAFPTLARAAQPPLSVTIPGDVRTYSAGLQHVWITSCPTVITPGAGTLISVRNATTTPTNVVWWIRDSNSATDTTSTILDLENSGLAPGAIVTIPQAGLAYVHGLVFNCSGPLPPAPVINGVPLTGAGPIEVLFR